RGVVEKHRLSPQFVALEVPHYDRAHAHRLSGRRPTKKRPKVSPPPLVLGDNARLVGTENAADAHGKIGKSLPMPAISLGGLLRSNERLRHTDNVVEAVGRHAAKQGLHVVLAFRPNMLAQHRHPLCRNLHLLSSRSVRRMSALPPKADIGTQCRNVRFVPKADIKAPPSKFSESIAGKSIDAGRRINHRLLANFNKAASWPVEIQDE